MQHRHADIKENVIAVLVGQDGLEALPAVQIEVLFQQMIEAAISADLELRTDPETSTGLFCLDNALNDA